MGSTAAPSASLKHLALSESGFLFDTGTGQTFTLNPTGTLILRALIDGRGLDEIPALVTEEFEVDETSAQRDLAEFLLLLKEMGLMARGGGDA